MLVGGIRIFFCSSLLRGGFNLYTIKVVVTPRSDRIKDMINKTGVDHSLDQIKLRSLVDRKFYLITFDQGDRRNKKGADQCVQSARYRHKYQSLGLARGVGWRLCAVCHLTNNFIFHWIICPIHKRPKLTVRP